MEDRPGKIFVGGLDFDIDEEEFEKIFAKFGKVTEGNSLILACNELPDLLV
jgi:RNA recognition motif-containing protein